MNDRARALLTVTLGAACLAAGCAPAPSAGTGASGSAIVGSSAPGASGGPPERSAITVGTLPIVDVAPIHIAIGEGFFEAEGLTVTTEVMQGGAAAIPALVGGDLDVAFGAWPSFLAANQQGIELRAVADGSVAAPGFTEFLALPGSGLEEGPARMAGATVAVNTLNNLGELCVRSTLREAGADPFDVTLVELPFPEMGAALERRDVDVIWAVEPAATIAKADLGAVVVADSFIGPLARFPVAGYQVTRAFAEQHPNTVGAFQRALARAVERAQDPSVVADVVPSFTTLTPELANRIALPAYSARLESADLARVYDHAVGFGILEPGLDVRALMIPAP